MQWSTLLLGYLAMIGLQALSNLTLLSQFQLRCCSNYIIKKTVPEPSGDSNAGNSTELPYIWTANMKNDSVVNISADNK